jgi:ParB family chromosome partitioning protein
MEFFPMANTVQKIALSSSRDIPFNQLVLSQSNIRRTKAGVSIEELAIDIERRTLLQSLTVRPVLDNNGAETGMFEIPAGGRRYRALELLVKREKLAKTAPIPCVVRTEGIAEEDSLAENVQRAPLHPLDQFRAFQTLREKGQTEEEIAAAFFVAVTVVKQRLRLASVSPRLLDIYAEDGMTLDQLMAFTVSPDHERQDQVWEATQRSYNKEPYQIRRLLTEGAVRASDKRAQYAGEDYVAAGGAVMRDLFQQDDGGWLQDVGLLERLVQEKLTRDAESIRAEGWKWVEAAIEFPYGHAIGIRLLKGERRQLTDDEIAKVEALRQESEAIEEASAAADEISEETEARLAEIETEIEAIHNRPLNYDPAEMANAGAFVRIDGAGRLRIERGYVRPEDEVQVEESEVHVSTDAASDQAGDVDDRGDADDARQTVGGANGGHAYGGANSDEPAEPAEEDEGMRPLSDRLLTELTAFRTLALRDAVGNDPSIAYLAVLHNLCLRLFYRYGLDSCLDIEAKSVIFGNQAPGLADTALAARIDERHRNWAEQLPQDSGALWVALQTFDTDSREALFAHCVSLTVNAVHDGYTRRPKAMAHADRLAEAVSLDVAAAGWTPNVDNFFGRVTKARILDAVRDVKGTDRAEAMRHLKKDEMAEQAEQLLSRSGWLPEPLRTVGVETFTAPVVETPAVDGADQMPSGEPEGAGEAEAQEPDAGADDLGELPDPSLVHSQIQDIAAE